MRTLFVTCVGSHMWRMNNEESDVDLAVIYIAPTDAILRGERIPVTTGQQMNARQGIIYDTLGWEIGHLINQLLKGNVNAIWYTTSPIVIQPSSYQEELRSLVESNLCRNTYRSLAGMAESQIEVGKKMSGVKGKGLRTALRTMNFGIELLTRGRLYYEPVCYTPDLDVVLDKKQQLLLAYESSNLPDLPDEEVFRDFLFRLRMDEMAGKIRCGERPHMLKEQTSPDNAA